MSQRRLWNKDFTVALVISVFLAFVFYLLVTSMVGYAVLRFAAGETSAGFASTAFVLGSVLTRPLAGKLMDVVGRRRLLTIALVLAAVVSLAYFFVDSLGLFILSRLVHGMLFGAGHTTLNAAAQDLIPSDRRSEGSGYFATSMTLGSALGPLIAVTTVDAWGYTALFGISLAFSLVALVGLPFLRLPERRLTAAKLREALSPHPRTLVDPDGFRMGAVIFLTSAAYSGILAFLATHAAASGAGASSSPVFFSCFAVASLSARLTIGRIQDVYGDNVVLYPLFASFAASCLLLAFWPTVTGMVLAGLLAGFGYGSLITCAMAIAVRTAGLSRVGLVTSTYLLCMDLGMGLGAIVLGAAAGAWGYSALYVLCAVFVVASAGWYALVHGRFPRAGRAGAPRRH
ncbi:MFS transporter [Brevibacterium jeotgali]|uniref:Predicted arabinose efflux permease, MFS family n=1 Tax=Brevibacterium jeotgali TaxID=1262550 RepID=A0A2H1L676_9MICO|nr:MFS transporter [Brevibacterium jeotgali]TWC03595.1 putative MFS family arabinose efflux permease [Brevibacterium jeotgali]SMY12418.1 Predicted arabinose efflux permease, MFS family [Brevibacterium jeotgali]